MFSSLTSTSVVIESSLTSTCLLIEECIFSQDSSDTEGGSLKFSTVGQCIQSRICGYQSKVTSDKEGVFCYVKVSATSNSKNALVDSTITESGVDLVKGYKNVYLINGDQYIESLNISYTKIPQRVCYEFSNMNTNTSTKYSSFCNNTDTEKYYLSYHTGSSSFISFIRNCNYLFNEGIHSIISVNNVNAIVYGCSILQNAVIYETFFLYGNSKYISLDQCYVDKYAGDTSKLTISNEINDKYTLQLSHLSTALCQAINKLVFDDKGDSSYGNKIRVISYNECKFVDTFSYVFKLNMIYLLP